MPVSAQWKLAPGASSRDSPTAVIEMANASGLSIAGGDLGNDPMKASTTGTGQLILRAISLGAGRVIVGCGGSATTDGGAGALEAIGSPEAVRGVELVAACDVTTGFLDAAKVFAPQKGATPATGRGADRSARASLGQVPGRFRVGCDSAAWSRCRGRARRGLAALGAELVSGFELVAGFVHLDEHLALADLVMTGEGYLDSQSFSGKVVGGVVRHVAGRAPILCIVGDAAAGRERHRRTRDCQPRRPLRTREGQI